MNDPRVAYRFRRFAPDGRPVRADSLLGRVGFGETYRGTCTDDDPLVRALRGAEDADLVRSFCIAWLSGDAKGLGDVVAFAVPLPGAVSQVCRIGALGRAADRVRSGALRVARAAVMLELAWEVLAFDPEEVTAAALLGDVATEVAADALFELVVPSRVLGSIDGEFGCPGEASPTREFRAAPVQSFVRLCDVRRLVQRVDADDAVRAWLLQRIDQRIFALFLVASRQTEGLVQCGAAGASAAVVVHAALALGLIEHPERETLLDVLRRGVEGVTEEVRGREVAATLAAVEQNLGGSVADAERRLRRHAVTSTTSDAADVLAAPLEATFDVLGAIAGGLGRLAGDTMARRLFRRTEEGFTAASNAVDAAPDVVGRALQGGASAEDWVRGVLRRAMPLGRRGSRTKK